MKLELREMANSHKKTSWHVFFSSLLSYYIVKINNAYDLKMNDMNVYNVWRKLMERFNSDIGHILNVVCV